MEKVTYSVKHPEMSDAGECDMFLGVAVTETDEDKSFDTSIIVLGRSTPEQTTRALAQLVGACIVSMQEHDVDIFTPFQKELIDYLIGIEMKESRKQVREMTKAAAND